MAQVKFEEGTVSIDATVIGRGLNIEPSLVQGRMREGKITVLSQRGTRDQWLQQQSQFGPTSAQARPRFRVTSRDREVDALGGQGYAWKTTGRDEVSIFLAGDRRTASCAGAGRQAGATPARRP